jgi:hypothetical protein
MRFITQREFRDHSVAVMDAVETRREADDFFCTEDRIQDGDDPFERAERATGGRA